MSVEEIVKQANAFDYDEGIPLKYWLRSANTIQKEAQIYEQEGNDQQTYLLLYRHAILVLEKLGQHPQAKIPPNRATLAAARKVVQRDLAKMEQLKPRIDKRRAIYLEEMGTRRVQDKELQDIGQQDLGGLVDGMSRVSLHSRQRSDGTLYSPKKSLDAGQNQTLAAQLAHNEIRRRDTARRAVRQAGVSPEEEQERRVGGVWGDWEKDLATRGVRDEADQLSRDIVEAGRWRDAVKARHHKSIPSAQRSSSYQYPRIPERSIYELRADLRPLPPGLPPKLPPKAVVPPTEFTPIFPPVKPPKQFKIDSRSEDLAPPPIPGKIPALSSAPSQEPNATDFNFKPSAWLENGQALRTVFLSPDLRTRFLAIAASNTRQNLETCGILCGTLISNALFVSKLVIPEQTSTSDTCETLNESALFEYCDAEDLMVLGWIHTHPTQTCFMSSRDLHTHCGYQVMMAESIAIVCAPSKDPSWGIFRLTDPPGMKTVLNCQQSGLFHQHNVENIYTDALKPGHVFELPGLEFQVVDQRP